jgi:hypothetical protein
VVRWGAIDKGAEQSRRLLAGKFEAQVGYFHSGSQYLQYNYLRVCYGVVASAPEFLI